MQEDARRAGDVQQGIGQDEIHRQLAPIVVQHQMHRAGRGQQVGHDRAAVIDQQVVVGGLGAVGHRPGEAQIHAVAPQGADQQAAQPLIRRQGGAVGLQGFGGHRPQIGAALLLQLDRQEGIAPGLPPAHRLQDQAVGVGFGHKPGGVVPGFAPVRGQDGRPVLVVRGGQGQGRQRGVPGDGIPQAQERLADGGRVVRVGVQDAPERIRHTDAHGVVGEGVVIGADRRRGAGWTGHDFSWAGRAARMGRCGSVANHTRRLACCGEPIPSGAGNQKRSAPLPGRPHHDGELSLYFFSALPSISFLALTAIFCTGVGSLLGSLMVSMPFSSSASAFSKLTSSGRRTARLNLP